MGIEPTTPCLQSRCSSQLSYVPGMGSRRRDAPKIPAGRVRPPGSEAEPRPVGTLGRTHNPEYVAPTTASSSATDSNSAPARRPGHAPGKLRLAVRMSPGAEYRAILMFLALKEMARAKARFGLLIAAIGLLVFLILFQQAIQNGLINSFVGAIRSQSAPVLVYSVDGQRVIQGSIITPGLEAAVDGADGVGDTGRIYQGTFTANVDGGVDGFDATLLGYEAGPDGAGLGAPTTVVEGRLPTVDGEVVASTEGDVQAAVDEKIIDAKKLPEGYFIEYGGQYSAARLRRFDAHFFKKHSIPYDIW